MTRFVVLDSQGRPAAFYSTAVHGNRIPKPAVEITDDQYKQLLAGQGTVALVNGALVASTPAKPPMTWPLIRRRRNRLLALTDWTQLGDSPLSQRDKEAWAVYRAALRDVPQKNADPNAVNWPTAPKGASS